MDLVQERWKALNEINAGSCEELTYEEVQAHIQFRLIYDLSSNIRRFKLTYEEV